MKTFLGASLLKYIPMPFGENIVVCPESNFVGLRKKNSIEVWKLGQGKNFHQFFERRKHNLEIIF